MGGTERPTLWSWAGCATFHILMNRNTPPVNVPSELGECSSCFRCLCVCIQVRTTFSASLLKIAFLNQVVRGSGTAASWMSGSARDRERFATQLHEL